MTIAILLVALFGSPALVVLALMLSLGEWFLPAFMIAIVAYFVAFVVDDFTRHRSLRKI